MEPVVVVVKNSSPNAVYAYIHCNVLVFEVIVLGITKKYELNARNLEYFSKAGIDSGPKQISL